MRSYREKEKYIPVRNEVDVLVIGSGPAGFGSAVFAAKNGAKTMIIEKENTLGGMMTAGLMTQWCGTAGGEFFHGIQQKNDVNFDEGSINNNYNIFMLQNYIFEIIEEYNISVLLYTMAADAIVENNEVKGVIIESKSGREAILAKIVIDASGDADIAARAGVPFDKGREEDGKIQPMTLMIQIAGVDEAKAVYCNGFKFGIPIPGGDLQQISREAEARGELLPGTGHVILVQHPFTPGLVTANITYSNKVDGTKVEDLTKSEFTCRKQIEPYIRFLRKYAPGYENCYLASTASLIGVRETRRIKGEYILNEKDITGEKIFEDRVVVGCRAFFDVHNLDGSGADQTNVHVFPTYTIPYRCFVPVKIDSLLVSGRCISGTHYALSNYRMMPICLQMGQATGTAAALCIKEGVKPRNLDVKLVQQILQSQGVEI